MSSAREAVRLGILQFPPEGKSFPGRSGRVKDFVLDTRGAVSNIPLRRLIVSEMWSAASAQGTFDVVAGVSKSGTVWGAWLAWEHNLPYANILVDGPRASGLQREIEGEIQGKSVVVVDNWIRTGASLQKAAEVVKRSGGQIACAVCTVQNQPIDVGFKTLSLWDIRDLLALAFEEGLISEGRHLSILQDMV